ncbi:MAG TPA: thioesterase family protein [Chitinophaga sp.]
MFTSTTQIRVRYGETDQMGYLYYGNYALYYEVGRTDAIRSLGLTYREVEALGVMMPVAEMQVKYIRPAYYDDLITIRTILKAMPDTHKIIFHSELYNEKEELLNVGVTTLAFVDAVTKKRASMPGAMRQKLLPFFTEAGPQ